MKIMGFNFTKISIEKLKDRSESLKINTHIDVTEIKELKTDILKTEEQIIGVKFSYSVKYEPEFANIDFKGSILLSLEEDKAKEVIKEWKKKKMPEDFQTILFNLILRKTAAKALQLEDEMNLPLHIPLPTVRSSKEK
jgi:hypothetical protein